MVADKVSKYSKTHIKSDLSALFLSNCKTRTILASNANIYFLRFWPDCTGQNACLVGQAKAFHFKPDRTLVIGQVGEIRTPDFCLHIGKNIFQSITPILNLSIEKAVDLQWSNRFVCGI